MNLKKKSESMPSFEDLGLREELLRTLEEEDISDPTALQAAVIPALRRGGNFVARASSGSGKTLAYALGVLDRIVTPVVEEEETEDEGAPALRVLVVAPTADEADRIALSLTPYAQAVGMRVSAPSAAWGTPAAEAGVLVGPPGDLMGAVRSSSLKLDDVEALVIDGASALLGLGQLEQVDALMDLIPRDAQRVLISAGLPAAVEDLVERRLKRALRYPAEPAIPGLAERPEAEGVVGYVVVREEAKLALLAAQLGRREQGSPPIIFCRGDERAADLAEALTVRGFLVGQADDEEADVAVAAGGVSLAELMEDTDAALGQSISYDVPADAATLRARHAGDADAIVLVEPRELTHLKEIAQLARLTARPTPLPHDIPSYAADLEAFRAQIREAVTSEDLGAQLLILEPLLEEFTAAEVAAATAALLRARRGAATTATTAPTASSSRSDAPRATPSRTPDAGPAPVTWARLFVGVGSRDEARPGDIVGALAGESGIPGSSVGKIEIRDSFSIVEVRADVADRVIAAVNGITLKGRSVRVDYDRGGPARGAARGGPPRRTSRRPPEG